MVCYVCCLVVGLINSEDLVLALSLVGVVYRDKSEKL